MQEETVAAENQETTETTETTEKNLPPQGTEKEKTPAPTEADAAGTTAADPPAAECIPEGEELDRAVLLPSGHKPCLAVANGKIALERYPEVSRLAAEIRADAGKDTSERPAADVPAVPEKKPRAGRAGTRRRDKLMAMSRTRRLTVLSLLLLFAGLVGFVTWQTVAMLRIFGSVNYEKSRPDFDGTELVVSESAMRDIENFRLRVSHSDETKNILLIGCDVDKNGISRSDSMILLSLDHTHKKIKMTSLMRDMRLRIPGKGKHKLNAAYTFGGGDLLLRTIYSNFGLKVDKYVCVDYAAFVKVVDYLGGVEVTIEEMELKQFNKYVSGGEKNRLDSAGTYLMNGKQALSYCRIRKVGTDTARTARQRRVLKKLMTKCRSMSPLEAEKMLSIIAPSLTTNLSWGEIIQLVAEGLDCTSYDTLGTRIPVDGTWEDVIINKVWYVSVNLNRNARYLNEFIYGDDETAMGIAERVSRTDMQTDAYERRAYEKRKSRR